MICASISSNIPGLTRWAQYHLLLPYAVHTFYLLMPVRRNTDNNTKICACSTMRRQLRFVHYFQFSHCILSSQDLSVREMADYRTGGRDPQRKQEVLGWTNRLLFFHMTRTASKMSQILHRRGNVFTEMLTRNDREIHRRTSLLLLRVFVAVGTCFPSHCAATIGGIHI
jgi:hypothetical protein